MTGIELIDKLRTAIEDPSANIFTDDNCIDAINNAHLELGNILPIEKLADLQTTHTFAPSNTNDSEDLPEVPFRGAVLDVRQSTSSEHTQTIEIIPKSMSRAFNNHYYTPDIDYPMCYIDDLGNTPIINYWGVGTGVITVTYLSKPTVLTSGSLSSFLPFEDNIEIIALALAESILWKIDNKPQRVDLAYKKALGMVEVV